MASIVCEEKALLDGLLHRVDPIDSYVKRILCYPEEGCKVFVKRINEIQKHGVIGFLNYGEILIAKNVRIIGKGYSSIVVLACLEQMRKPIALKIRRLDSRRKSLEYEGIMLDYLSSTGYTPILYFWSKDFIGMEYVRGVSLEKFIEQTLATNNIKGLFKTLTKVLSASYFFDLLGVDHTELNRPYGHIIVTQNNLPVFLDWESARIRKLPHNLTMVASYLFIRSKYSECIRRLLGINRKNVIDQLRKYKYSPAPVYLRLIKLFQRVYREL